MAPDGQIPCVHQGQMHGEGHGRTPHVRDAMISVRFDRARPTPPFARRQRARPYRCGLLIRQARRPLANGQAALWPCPPARLVVVGQAF